MLGSCTHPRGRRGRRGHMGRRGRRGRHRRGLDCGNRRVAITFTFSCLSELSALIVKVQLTEKSGRGRRERGMRRNGRVDGVVAVLQKRGRFVSGLLDALVNPDGGLGGAALMTGILALEHVRQLGVVCRTGKFGKFIRLAI